MSAIGEGNGICHILGWAPDTQTTRIGDFGFPRYRQTDEANEAPFSVAYLPSGWSIIWSNVFEYASRPDTVRRSSASSIAPVSRFLIAPMVLSCSNTSATRKRWEADLVGPRIDLTEFDCSINRRSYISKGSLASSQFPLHVASNSRQCAVPGAILTVGLGAAQISMAANRKTIADTRNR